MCRVHCTFVKNTLQIKASKIEKILIIDVESGLYYCILGVFAIVTQKNVWMFARVAKIGLYLCHFLANSDEINSVRRICILAL